MEAKALKQLQNEIKAIHHSPERYAIMLFEGEGKCGIIGVNDLLKRPVVIADKLLVAKLTTYDKTKQMPMIVIRASGMTTMLINLDSLDQ